MKLKSFYLTLITVVLMGCNSFSQNLQKEERKVTGFTGIELSIAGDIELIQGEQFKVILEADADKIKDVETTLKGETLVIETHKSHLFNNSKVRLTITLPELKSIEISGAGDINAQGEFNCKDLELEISGAGDLKFNQLSVNNLTIDISGAGDITINGDKKANNLKIDINGAGDVTIEKLPFETATADINGSGSCRINVTTTLNADINGSGDLLYSADPKMNIEINGSGKIKKI
mgnify:CR=1 FL=1